MRLVVCVRACVCYPVAKLFCCVCSAFICSFVHSFECVRVCITLLLSFSFTVCMLNSTALTMLFEWSLLMILGEVALA